MPCVSVGSWASSSASSAWPNWSSPTLPSSRAGVPSRCNADHGRWRRPRRARVRLAPHLPACRGAACRRRPANEGMMSRQQCPATTMALAVIARSLHFQDGQRHRPHGLKPSGLQLPREGRRVWRYDSRPADVHRRVQVRMGGVSTRDTEELRLRLAIGFLTMPTVATGLAGIGRIDVDHPHTSQRRLVGDEGAKLEECPTVQHSPLALNRSLRAFADVLEVFKRNPARSAFRRLHNGLAQTVVDVASEALSRARCAS